MRFCLSLKRAEIVLIAPESEPLRVICASVERTPAREAETRLVTRQISAEAHGKAGFSLSETIAPGADLSLGAQAHRFFTTWQEFTDTVTGQVEQAIKEELLSAGFLQLADLGEKHADLVIAEVIFSEDW
ncbi:hypothetical protein [uncultured Roseobacter sp.]|uniref:hypothetical protein n=1 Tax=uncultured Roseobacter sp. TaxID=114847 RepID=UPI002615B735|nr:hypothetical protein [uncultured Roseobacter sp.]